MNNCAGLLLNKREQKWGRGGGCTKKLQGPSTEAPSHFCSSDVDACILVVYGSEHVKYNEEAKEFCFAYFIDLILFKHTSNCKCVCAFVCIGVASNTLQMVKCVCSEERKRTNASQLEYTLMRNTDDNDTSRELQKISLTCHVKGYDMEKVIVR